MPSTGGALGLEQESLLSELKLGLLRQRELLHSNPNSVSGLHVINHPMSTAIVIDFRMDRIDKRVAIDGGFASLRISAELNSLTLNRNRSVLRPVGRNFDQAGTLGACLKTAGIAKTNGSHR
jgi:hypothetical protein